MVKQQVPEFAARLRKLREAVGLTQQGLAERAGMHVLSVAKLEQAIREPSWATVIALSKALGISCEAFMGEADDGAEELPRRGPGRPAKRAVAPSPEAASASARRPKTPAKKARPKGKAK
jgi:transcriptional regulator with XRE-family HTH domain